MRRGRTLWRVSKFLQLVGDRQVVWLMADGVGGHGQALASPIIQEMDAEEVEDGC